MIKETAAIVFYDKYKRILLIQRTFDAPENPGCWSFFGGHVEKGENPLQTVVREAKEELGISIKNPEFLLVTEYKFTNHISKIYVYINPYRESMILKQSEGRTRGWYTIQEALKLNLSQDVRVAIKKIGKVGGKKFIIK